MSEPTLSERLRARRGFFRTDVGWMMGAGFDTDCVEAADALDAQAKLLEEAREVLPPLLRIIEAVKFTDGLGKNQLARVDAAKALLSKLEHPHDGQQ